MKIKGKANPLGLCPFFMSVEPTTKFLVTSENIFNPEGT